MASITPYGTFTMGRYGMNSCVIMEVIFWCLLTAMHWCWSNVDWFQPFEHYTYSVGVICLVLNLSRAVQYKRENIILVGIIPGPTEPHLTMNSYLTPLVSDILQLWSGVLLPTSHQLIRAALLAVSCDLPAGWKVCGFLSHSANLGCSRCYCPFSEGFGSWNYSDFDRASWQLRGTSV